MASIKHADSILVATDMSPRADRAVQRAFRIARQKGLGVKVLTVIDDAMPDDLVETVHDKALSNVDRFASTVADGVPYEVMAEAGDPTQCILTAAQNNPESLLVLGVHRSRPFLDVLRETTMQRVVRQTENPVLLVKDAADHDYDHVLAACDFSPASTAAMEFGGMLSGDGMVTPVHVVHMPYRDMLESRPGVGTNLEASFVKEAQAAETEWRNCSDLSERIAPTTEMPVGAPYAVFKQLADHGGADLITVGAHSDVGAPRSVLGSLSIDLMREPPCDVLIARP